MLFLRIGKGFNTARAPLLTYRRHSTAAGPARKLDTINELRVDHYNIKDLFLRYKGEQADSRALNEVEASKPLLDDLFHTIMREITVHSIAEQHSVYKALAKIAEVDARRLRDQHHHLEEKIATLLWSETNDTKQEQELNHIVKLFVDQAKEDLLCPGYVSHLVKTLSPTANDDLARSFVSTRKAPLAVLDEGTKAGRSVSVTPSKTQARILKQLSVKDFVDDATLRYTHPALEPVGDLKLDDAVFAE
ncbi:hypothetical protein BCR35DRAFT_331639 [Leucosporidium creatinivorum]|uniref:Hemerythrin-like domain-containing protein n=1 Tax=Leucosporidium creatinivorum TaxID=106004 RepID=A0A1Y2FBG2_9BASI|nr:hypothetical protein BCR35DRAFT_331639 [Leucosporidium creatinivorum]